MFPFVFLCTSTNFLSVIPNVDRWTSPIVANGYVFVEELYSDMTVENGKSTAHASSSGTKQGSQSYLLYPM